MAQVRTTIVGVAFVCLVLVGGFCDPPAFPTFPEAAGQFAVAAYGDSLTGQSLPGSYMNFVDPSWFRIARGASGQRGLFDVNRLVNDIPRLLDPEEVDVVVMMWGTNDVYWVTYAEHPAEVEVQLEAYFGGTIPGGTDLQALPDGTTLEDLIALWLAEGAITQAQADSFFSGFFSGDQLADALIAGADQVRFAGIEVVVCFPPPIIDPADTLQNDRLAALLPRIEQRLAIRPEIGFVDLFEVFGNHPDPTSLYLPDGLHLNAAGKQEVASAVEAAVAVFAP